jgi:hypothetical protein
MCNQSREGVHGSVRMARLRSAVSQNLPLHAPAVVSSQVVSDGITNTEGTQWPLQSAIEDLAACVVKNRIETSHCDVAKGKQEYRWRMLGLTESPYGV